MNSDAHIIDTRAVRASGTVKNRMIMCGSPADPKNIASPSDRAESGAAAKVTGASIDSCFGCRATALASKAL